MTFSVQNISALIDADILLYRATSSAESEFDWGDDIWSLVTDLDQAKDNLKQQITSILATLKIKDSVMCLSDHGNNFRKLVDPTYKGNRKGTRKPVGYVALATWLKENYPFLQMPSLEGDDVIGLMATRPDNKGKVVMVSDDKDLKSVYGKLYRPTTDEQLEISEAEADKFFLTQTLTGDTADGYKGLVGIGPKKAEAILGARPDWSAVEQAYIKQGQTRDDAIRQARLARILRWSEWDAEKETLRLWTPPNYK